tara:strand:- start:2103 stop:2945 length:843 start_codon:yes stop_codon:yes gene_type:complete
MLAVISVIAMLTSGCAKEENENSAYAFELVELPTNGPSVDDPNRSYRELWEATSLRAEQEVLDQSEVSAAYLGRTYFGGHSDSVLVYAITPERGVFYYLPPGPYDPQSNAVLTLPDRIEACRLEIEWAKLDQYPFIDDLGSLHFVSKDCQPFDPEEYLSEDVEAGQQFEIESESATGEASARLVTSSIRSGDVDVANAISAVMAEDGRELARTVPLAGINEYDVTAGLASDGSVYLLSSKGSSLSFTQRCVFDIGEWANVSDSDLRLEAERACLRIAERR